MSAVLGVVAFAVVGWALRPVRSRPVAARTADGPERRRRPRSQRLDRVYPEALELFVLAVRAGHLPISAMRATTPLVGEPVGGAFAAVVARVDGGERFADALDTLPARLGPTASGLSDSLAAAERYGLPLAPVLERLTDEARQQRRRRHETAARQLPVRLSIPLVVCILPSFVLVAVVPLLLAALSSLDN